MMNFLPSDAIANSILALYFEGKFAGTCIGVAPRMVVTAGHHAMLNRDDIGQFTVMRPSRGRPPVRLAAAEYAAKDRPADLLVLWLDAPVPFVPIRGYLPGEAAHVATVWLHRDPPHEVIVSPGIVSNSAAQLCEVRGTVSTVGCSGAAVVNMTGTVIVGMHLSSNTKQGVRVSEFAPARNLLATLSQLGISLRDVVAEQRGTKRDRE